MPGKLQDKVVIITGGGQGFGAGIVDKFRAEGAEVVLVDLRDDTGKKKAQEAHAAFFKADVSSRADWEALLKFVDEKYGRLDCVVNNAGWTYVAKSSLEVTEEEYHRVMAINVDSFFHSTSVLVPYLQRQGKGGVFVTISSTAAIRPRANLTWYNATKGAVSIASKSLAVEMAKDQIRFTSVCPVAGNTPLLQSFAGQAGLTPDKKDMFIGTIPLGRLSEPSDVANAVAFLASDEASFITGIDLEVDGGRCV